MPITNESLVSDLPGCSPAQAVALNRLGISRVGELIAADYESVAVTLESFDEATRIIREAKKQIEANTAGRAPNGTAQNVQRQQKVVPPQRPRPQVKPQQAQPTQVHSGHQVARPAPQQQARPGAPVQQQARPGNMRYADDQTPSNPLLQEPVHDANVRNRPGNGNGNGNANRADEPLSLALSYAGRGVDLNSDDETRATLSRRLGAASFLLEHEATEADTIASLILEAVEDGTIPPNAVSKAFGDEVAVLIEECATIRAVPVSPLGKLPKYYMEMAQKASVSARRICAAHQIANLHLNAEAAAAAGESRGGLVWYARLLLEGLEAAGPDPVVSLLRSSVDALSRVAA